MRRRELLRCGVSAGLSAALTGTAFAQRTSAASLLAPGQADAAPRNDRSYWVEQLQRVALPVLAAGSQGKLVATMPVEAKPGHEADRRKVTHLEALGRTLAGIAPWLESDGLAGEEEALRRRYCEMARAAIAFGVNRDSPDYLHFGEDRQTIVDSGFLSLALARAPRELCGKLPATVKTQLADALRRTRALLPPFNNWLLFAAMIEACLYQLGEAWDRSRVDYAFREHAAWFLGDGVYGDGPHFHADYYNSFVIHPFLLALGDAVGSQEPAWAAMLPTIHARTQRYGAIQERLIAPDGSYPVVGRSIAYRCGAFHLLADVALRRALAEGLAPEQVRCALAAVIHRTLGAPGTFDGSGWLQIGLAGHQPSLGEAYISTGSLYLCSAALLPLGLPPGDRFWAAESAPFTSQRVWGGKDLPADHAQDG